MTQRGGTGSEGIRRWRYEGEEEQWNRDGMQENIK
jgi:hypothetical protein